MARDRTLYCNDCGQPFAFTVREQQFYASKNIINAPNRCSGCRAKQKARVDQTLTCVDCQQTFVFSKGEQDFYEKRSITAPTRCQACRERNKAQPRGKPVQNTGQPRQMYSVYCSDCGTQTQVPFEPRQGRPVYCRNCYPAHKRA